jgi:hypothetical protein
MDYLHCYCRGYHVYKFVSLIIEVPNESYLGNITITIRAHIIKSEEPSIIQGINYYYNNTLQFYNALPRHFIYSTKRKIEQIHKARDLKFLNI